MLITKSRITNRTTQQFKVFVPYDLEISREKGNINSGAGTCSKDQLTLVLEPGRAFFFLLFFLFAGIAEAEPNGSSFSA